jgi:RNA-directed DNA polymerase
MSINLSLSSDEIRERFCNLSKREDIAELLDISDSQLRYHLYIFPISKAYKEFKVPKRAKGYRVIHAPRTSLKIIQRKLNQVLNCVYQPKPSTYGFTIGKSIIDNAERHLQQKCVLNLDIKDFFPSINFGRVRGLFMAYPYNCPKEVATVLAQICCYEKKLPQGAPTSPTISNMICARMDSQLQYIARKHRCIYTRYADDITFSTSKSRFPGLLAFYSDKEGKFVLGEDLREIIEQNGFSVNESKVRLRTQYQHQEVTGITVNQKLNVRRKYVRQIRAMLHAWAKYGLELSQKEFHKKRNLEGSEISFRDVVKGKIEFLGNVKGEGDPIYVKFLQKLKQLAPEMISAQKLERAHAQLEESKHKEKLPCNIWTEGKTDIMHLKAALRDLQKRGEFQELEIKFEEDVPKENQGEDNLLKRCEFASDTQHLIPMIAVFDHDSDSIIKLHDNAENFKNWKGNGVYSFVIPVPGNRHKEKNICIEHYYQDDEIKRKDSNNRRLFLGNEFDHRSFRHKNDGEISVTKKYDPIKIIDNDVFNCRGDNVALSKANFASNVFEQEENFNDFDFTEFIEIFKIVRKILKSHNASESTKESKRIQRTNASKPAK